MANYAFPDYKLRDSVEWKDRTAGRKSGIDRRGFPVMWFLSRAPMKLSRMLFPPNRVEGAAGAS